MSIVSNNNPSPNLEGMAKQAATDKLQSMASDKLQQAEAFIENKIAEKLSEAEQKAAEMKAKADKIRQGAALAAQAYKANPPMAPAIQGINGPVNSPGAAAPTSRSEEQPPAATPEKEALKIGHYVEINGDEITNVQSIQIAQSYGKPNQLTMRVFSDGIQQPGIMKFDGAEKLLGKVAKVILRNAADKEKDPLNNLFIITNIELEQEGLNEGVLVLSGQSPDYLLQGMPHFEAFVNKKLADIVSDIFTPYTSLTRATLQCNPSYKETIGFACCFNQNYYNFLKRYASELGEWIYFDGKSLCYGKPHTYEQTQLVYGGNCSHLRMSVQMHAVQDSLKDYETDTHKPMQQKASAIMSRVPGLNAQAFQQSVNLFGQKKATAHPRTLEAKDKALEAMAQSRSSGMAANLYTISGESINWSLHVGKTAELSLVNQGKQEVHTIVRILSVSHVYAQNGMYSNTFTAISSDALIPPPVDYVMPHTHPVLAEVTNNSDAQGRVKVKFLGWNDGKENMESNWIRVLTPDAGGGGAKVAANRGLVTIPEVGDHVMVDFTGGNPEKPFVTGSVFQGKHGTGGGGGNNVKSLTSKSGHTVQLDDGGGITIKDKSGKDSVVLDGTNKITVTAAQIIELTTGKASITLDGDVITLTGKIITAEASESADMSSGDAFMQVTAKGAVANLAGKKTTVEGSDKVVLTGADATVNGDSKTGVTSQGPTSIEGAIVKLN